jgi:ATP-dependent DNA ligase
VTAAVTMARRRELVDELSPYRENALDGHPWGEWATAERDAPRGKRMPGATSRWNAGRDLAWEPLRPELVAEVAFDHLQGSRFRHATHFRRWRRDRDPRSCDYAQLDAVPAYLLQEVFGAGR